MHLLKLVAHKTHQLLVPKIKKNKKNQKSYKIKNI